MKSHLNHYQNVYKNLEPRAYDLVMSLTDDLAKSIDITGYLQGFVMTEVKKRLSQPFGGLFSERNLRELVDIKVWNLQGEIGRGYATTDTDVISRMKTPNSYKR
jgi:hypothetical protein